MASSHIGTSCACFNIFILDTFISVTQYCHIRKLVFLGFFGFIRIFLRFSFRIKLNIINIIFLTLCNIWHIVWVCYVCVSWIGNVCLGILEIDILAFDVWNEHIFSNFKHSEWCHVVILIDRFNQSWKVSQLIDVWLHVLWLSINQFLQLNSSLIDLVEDLILVSCLEFID